MSRHSSRKEILGVETSEINTMNILLKVSQLLLLSSPVWSSAVGNPSCGHALDLPSVIFLDKFCTDCYNVYRLDEVYQNCQADCYDNDVLGALVWPRLVCVGVECALHMHANTIGTKPNTGMQLGLSGDTTRT